MDPFFFEEQLVRSSAAAVIFNRAFPYRKRVVRRIVGNMEVGLRRCRCPKGPKDGLSSTAVGPLCRVGELGELTW